MIFFNNKDSPLSLLTALITLIITLNISLPGFTQEKKESKTLQHEVTVTIKLVQVYVTDRKGNPVVDLGKEDFIIYDNGKKQSITEF